MSNRPITPEEAVATAGDAIPDFVIEAFNELIKVKFDGRRAVIDLKDAARAVAAKTTCTADEIYDRKWLDVEPVFRRAGWEVHYDQPGFCETGPSLFTFTAPRPKTH